VSGEAYKAKLGKIEALRSLDDLDTVLTGVRKALRDRSNYIVAKAAAMAGSRYLTAAIPDLLGAYARLFGEEAAAADPLVLAKQAIAQALKDLDHREPEPYLRGLGHVQLEKTWGGSEDRAGSLRATCAHALVGCDIDSLALLEALIDHLVDPDKQVRLEVVRAIGQIGGHESVLVVRVKALAGDAEAEVLGECFRVLLARAPHESAGFVERFLGSARDGIALEAVSALAESRSPVAFAVVRRFWATEISINLRRAIVFSCAASPLTEARDFLLYVVADRRGDLAASAIAALAASRFRDDVRERVEQAVHETGDAAVIAAFAREFR